MGGENEWKGKAEENSERVRFFLGGGGGGGNPYTVFNLINLIPAVLTSRLRLQEHGD